MSLRSALSRVSGVVIAAALASAVAVSPAAAGDDWGGDGRGGVGGNGNDGNHGNNGNSGNSGNNWSNQQDRGFSKGVVTANTGLLLRSAPNRSSQVIRVAARGEVVRIFCQSKGESVLGDNRWYLLADGTWAWGSARYIKPIGASPRWC
ncbi:SH3 domain-containing protein [Streptomyces sp. NPDC018693]|uniref:SH3 domain-containing protein n=1 Tax=unclassified Streptomyces TaxID=2593676 RepID=UPI0037AAE57B